jgi:peptide/nickel transport system substrate-binding protein
MQRLERLLRERRIGRREFLSRVAAAGVVAAGTSLLPDATARAATPKQGGKIRFGVGHGSTTDSLDPATFTDTFMILCGWTLRNNLCEVDKSGKLVPELAESWDVSPDATEWTFKLRKGIEFHNGKTLDAGDVVASINHHRQPDSKSAARALLEALVEVKADGKEVVAFKLKEGNADFSFILSDYHIPIIPAKDGAIDWQSGVGTGGYVLQGYEPGVSFSAKRNPNYWKQGFAHFDEVEVLAIHDVTARTNALTTGTLEVIDRPELKTVDLLQKRPGLRVEETKGTLQYTVPMLTDVAPFDNNDVRLALKYGVKRQAMLDAILRGHGVVGNDHPIGLSNRYHASELPQREFDPDKAKFHLKKAGLETLTVDLSSSDAAFAGAVDAAVLYKEHAKEAGIEINVVREPADGYWSNVWMKKPWSTCYWSGRPTEDWMFSTAYADGAPWNDTHWSHARFNELLKLARAELDEGKRREMYVEMQRIVSDEGGVVVPMFSNHVFAMVDKIAHDEVMAGNWDLDGQKGPERWWYA